MLGLALGGWVITIMIKANLGLIFIHSLSCPMARVSKIYVRFGKPVEGSVMLELPFLTRYDWLFRKGKKDLIVVVGADRKNSSVTGLIGRNFSRDSWLLRIAWPTI